MQRCSSKRKVTNLKDSFLYEIFSCGIFFFSKTAISPSTFKMNYRVSIHYYNCEACVQM